MQEFLIMVTIGPVQDFIANARKLRDLWFGSYLLSELSKTVAQSLNEKGTELIFPSINSPDDLKPGSEMIVPNRILAKTTTHPAKMVKEAREAWQKAQNDFAVKALDKIKEIKSIRINEELYKKQIGDSGEFFAAWVEIENTYSESKNKLEQLIAGRKNLRAFNKNNWDGTGLYKSSLDGGRESVLKENNIEIRGLIKKGERLDTLGCVKRFYPIINKHNLKHFDDLSDVALIPYLSKIEKSENLKSLLDEYQGHFVTKDDGLRTSHNDNKSIYRLRILSDFLYVTEQDLGHLQDPKSAWKSFKKLTNRKYAGEPPKYACILVGDGDMMGKLLDKIHSAEGHQSFSKKLSQFAQKIERTIQEFKGSLIYAGGDDVMAYFPIHTALEGADKIRRVFAENMSEIISDLKIPYTEIPTFSIGLAIVHHASPLSKALQLARSAERIAKTKSERNSLAIIQSKRSGSDITIFGKWDDYDDQPGIISKLNSMISLYNDKEKSLPGTLGYQLRQARIECGDGMKFDWNNDKPVPKDAAAATVLRIFEHKDKSDNLKSLLNGSNSIKRLSDELIVAKQIADVKKILLFEEDIK